MVELIFLIALTGVFWGLGPIFDKFALMYFSSENTIFLRVISGAVLISIFAVIFGNPASISSEFNWKGYAAILGSAFVGFAGVYTFYRVINIPGSQVSIAYAIALAICPVITAILAHALFGENLFKLTKMIGIFLIVIGIILVSGKYDTQLKF